MSRFLGILTCLMISASVFGQIEVCSDCQFKTVPSAIESASPHDTVLVHKGIYPIHNMVITKPITLRGLNRPVLDGEDKGYIVKILSDSVSFTGFDIRRVGISHTEDYAAIYSFRADYLEISDNHLEDVFFGIRLEKSSNVVVKDNIVKGRFSREFDSGNGIHLWHCKNARVEGNDLSGLRDGIYFEFVDDSYVIANRSHHNTRYGLHYMFSNDDDYLDNYFYNNGAGVAVMFSKNIKMINNRFSHNWGTSSYGLLLKEIYDAEIKMNLFEKNTVAISVDGSSRIYYRNNDFIQNGWAIRVTGGCYVNQFTSNNFISNSFDVSYNSKLNDNLFQGNFWSSYSGYDIDRDGWGDIPYRPVKLFSYVVNRTPETIVLLRSFFIDIINFSERVTPVFTPDNLMDDQPSMKKIKW